MKKNIKMLLLLSALLMPRIVLAESDKLLLIVGAIFMEAFISIHMSLFVISPLSKIFYKEDPKKGFWKLFIIRACVLLFFDFFITPVIAYIDFLMVFIGGFIIVPLSASVKKTAMTNNISPFFPVSNVSKEVTNCTNCGEKIEPNSKFCTNCGEAITKVDQMELPIKNTSYDRHDPIYNKSDEDLLEEFINREFIKCGLDKNSKIITSGYLKKKGILNFILSILIFVYISLIFFHFPIQTYILGAIILLLVFRTYKKFDFMKYLKKEIKSRPSEKISNIIMTAKETQVVDNKKNIRIAINIVAVLISILIFINPRIMYEETTGGYAVRFYTFGLSNFTTAEIPEKHNGKPVVSLRGNTFSNMPFLKEVKLPNTIKEIRGQAFKNDINLVKVNIPIKLEYLGGGSFYNCKSIEKIELPDTLTFLGGESFYNAESLKSINLSENLTEIRGNSFENCLSLEKVTIPDKVERIGGHAFYGNSSLKEVVISENSVLKEIGSSAFRECSKLTSIKLPKETSINERAFKDSPTKIKRYGDVDYEEIVESTKYNYNNYLSFNSIGETKKVNEYNDKAIIYNTSITLTEVKYIYGYYEYTLKYKDETGEITFVLNQYSPYKQINENYVVILGDETLLTNYRSYFYIKGYYN